MRLSLCFEIRIGVSLDPIKALSVYKEETYKGVLSSKLFFAYHILKRGFAGR